VLESIHIVGFAVARDVTLEPGPGLNVFTGETGAGKSLIVDALAFLFGARRGREVIARGIERATVSARLSLDGELLELERTVGLSGRSSARLNGEVATLDQLQQLAARLVDIHGQSEQLAILRPAVQLAVLDEFAGLDDQRTKVTGLVRDLREVRRDLRSLSTDARERERLVDQLRFEVDEIAAAALTPGEDDELRREQTRLANTGRLLEHAAAALEALDGAPIAQAIQAVSDLVERDPTATGLADLAALLETATVDLAQSVRRYRDTLDEDPERLAEMEERLDVIARLRRKYGETIDDILTYARDAEARLAALGSVDVSIEALEAKERELRTSLAVAAAELSRARRAAAGDLVRAIAAELEHLGMGGATLSVGFACEDHDDGIEVSLPDYEIVITNSPLAGEGEALPRAFTETGVDRVEFLASFNPGETPRPLSSVASGGETSRFMLALTTVLGSTAEHRLVVFDEVDEGVGGRAGALVGEALRRLAQRHQVLSITHLPQVAAFGEHHFVVTKETDGARSWSEVHRLEGEARVAELAAMLGGESEATRQAAREMLSTPTA